MTKSTAIMELVAGYDSYAEPGELQIGAVSDAPEITPGIWFSIRYSAHVSSLKCATWVSAGISAVTGWFTVK
ncbi:LxmA leader domain family RiPP [Nonomuraea sp. NPDC000554]|uniref:LxmA leader domain family RiPP n=1 Tax=Nonomuraea sp. NPDC000554 TaxID=3154259 RepID=UPI00332D77AF